LLSLCDRLVGATGLASEVEHDFGSSTADPGVVTINTLAGGIAVAGMISASGGNFSWTGASERYDQAIGENSSVYSAPTPTLTGARCRSPQTTAARIRLVPSLRRAGERTWDEMRMPAKAV
jgi:hypothetical protein